MSDEIFNAAVDFLKNGGELPKNGNAQQRFIFIAASLREVYSMANDAAGQADANKTEIRILKIRYGLLGSLAIVGGAAIAILK